MWVCSLETVYVFDEFFSFFSFHPMAKNREHESAHPCLQSGISETVIALSQWHVCSVQFRLEQHVACVCLQVQRLTVTQVQRVEKLILKKHLLQTSSTDRKYLGIIYKIIFWLLDEWPHFLPNNMWEELTYSDRSMLLARIHVSPRNTNKLVLEGHVCSPWVWQQTLVLPQRAFLKLVPRLAFFSPHLSARFLNSCGLGCLVAFCSGASFWSTWWTPSTILLGFRPFLPAFSLMVLS